MFYEGNPLHALKLFIYFLSHFDTANDYLILGHHFRYYDILILPWRNIKGIMKLSCITIMNFLNLMNFD